MKYSGILLDLDNTLYEYKKAHDTAMNGVFEYAKEAIGADDFESAFKRARSAVHLELAESAASHNRLLYFQRSCEYLDISPLVWAMRLYNIYWDTFLESMRLYDGVIEFLEFAAKESRVCLVTDLTAQIQYRKIEKLGLQKYILKIVTSEEAGREKPHPYIFLLALHKLALKPNEVCMVGDSFEKDILGARRVGADGYLKSKDSKDGVSCFDSFYELAERLK